MNRLQPVHHSQEPAVHHHGGTRASASTKVLPETPMNRANTPGTAAPLSAGKLRGWCAGLLLAGALSAAAQDSQLYFGDDISPQVETLYQRGLQYLVNAQTAAGTWNDPRGSDPGVVGLAVLAMLAHGDDATHGPYRDAIRKGLNFILSSQRPDNGYIGNTMYNHGFATLALAEAYGMVDDPRLGPALKQAVDLILTAQKANGFGGWRYSPESTDADTTVSGAQVVALFAARNAGLAVPEQAIERALLFYQSCQGSDGGFGYTNASGTSAPRTAIGTLVFALARRQQTRPFQAAARNLAQLGHRDGSGYLFYYLYYAAQAHFRSDMNQWRKWNVENVKILSETQLADGSWSESQGTLFATSAALLSLAVNYRYLPIYER